MMSVTKPNRINNFVHTCSFKSMAQPCNWDICIQCKFYIAFDQYGLRTTTHSGQDMVKYKNISNLDDESWFVTSSNQMKSCHVWKCVEFI